MRVHYENQAHTDGPPKTAMAAFMLIPFVWSYLSLLSTTFYESSIGAFATCQELWVRMLVGSVFNMVSFTLMRGQ